MEQLSLFSFFKSKEDDTKNITHKKSQNTNIRTKQTIISKSTIKKQNLSNLSDSTNISNSSNDILKNSKNSSIVHQDNEMIKNEVDNKNISYSVNNDNNIDNILTKSNENSKVLEQTISEIENNKFTINTPSLQNNIESIDLNTNPIDSDIIMYDTIDNDNDNDNNKSDIQSSIMQKRFEQMKKKKELIEKLGISKDVKSMTENMKKNKTQNKKKIIHVEIEPKKYNFRHLDKLKINENKDINNQESINTTIQEKESETSEEDYDLPCTLQDYLCDIEQQKDIHYTSYKDNIISSISLCSFINNDINTEDHDTIEKSIENSTISNNKNSYFVFEEQKLKHIYALSTRDTYGDIFVSGGQGGYISLYSYNNFRSNWDIESESIHSSATYKYHRGWISGLSLYSSFDSLFLLSTSNDGYVSIHSLKNISKPKSIYSNNHIHDSGIFSLAVSDSSMFTVGKDACVIYSTITESNIQIQKKYTDLFSSIVKSIDINQNLFLAGGCDNYAILSDFRDSNYKNIQINSIHESIINKCFFHKNNCNYIYTTGDDEYICIYDIRNPSQPYSKLSNHASAKHTRKAIYSPISIYESNSIITPSPGTQNIYIYNILTGEQTYTGTLPEEINMITLSNKCPLGNILYATSISGRIYCINSCA